MDVSVYGRFLPGQTLEQAQAELSPVAAAGSPGGPEPTTGVRLESAARREARGAVRRG